MILMYQAIHLYTKKHLIVHKIGKSKTETSVQIVLNQRLF